MKEFGLLERSVDDWPMMLLREPSAIENRGTHPATLVSYRAHGTKRDEVAAWMLSEQNCIHLMEALSRALIEFREREAEDGC